MLPQYYCGLSCLTFQHSEGTNRRQVEISFIGMNSAVDTVVMPTEPSQVTFLDSISSNHRQI